MGIGARSGRHRRDDGERERICAVCPAPAQHRVSRHTGDQIWLCGVHWEVGADLKGGWLQRIRRPR